jgi:hypothetical protein
MATEDLSLRGEGDPREYLPDPTMIDTYGEEYIIVHKPSQTAHGGVDYFITESHNLPARTKEIIIELAERLKGA